MKDCIIGIDIGGTHLRIGAVDRVGNVHHFEKRESREVCAESGSAPRLIALIRDYLVRNGLDHRAYALAIGFPSTVSRDKRTVYSSPNLPLGGADGLAIIRSLLKQTENRLETGSPVLLEIGSEQADTLKAEAANYPWLEWTGALKDFCGNIRFAEYRAK